MPKYYVNAGELRKIMDRPDPETAAVDAFRTLETDPVDSLNSITVVSEEGFDSTSGDDLGFITMELLEQSDQLGLYKPDFKKD